MKMLEIKNEPWEIKKLIRWAYIWKYQVISIIDDNIIQKALL